MELDSLIGWYKHSRYCVLMECEQKVRKMYCIVIFSEGVYGSSSRFFCRDVIGGKRTFTNHYVLSYKMAQLFKLWAAQTMIVYCLPRLKSVMSHVNLSSVRQPQRYYLYAFCSSMRTISSVLLSGFLSQLQHRWKSSSLSSLSACLSTTTDILQTIGSYVTASLVSACLTTDHEVAGSIPGTSTNFKCGLGLERSPPSLVRTIGQLPD